MVMIDLSGQWKLRPVFKDLGIERFNEVLRIADGEFQMFATHGKHSAFPSKKGWMNAQVPCDVIETLMEHGIIDDPVEGLNTQKCQWIMDFSWWFVKEFDVPESIMDEEKVYLYFEMIDVEAEFVLNGVPVGRNVNAFAPFKEDVKRYIQPGKNQLILRLTPGFGSEAMVDSIANYGTNVFIDHPMHIYRRRPQFAEGWDWCPCIPTCGIHRELKLYGISAVAIDGVRVHTKQWDEQVAQMEMEIVLEGIRDYASVDAQISYTISFEGEEVASHNESMHVLGGINYLTTTFPIPNPRVWWPNGMGEHPLYDVHVQVESLGRSYQYPVFQVGIRMIEIDETPINDDERLYAFKVNGQRIFAKGGNWIPADSVYRRVSDEKYHMLIAEAAEANFNMLRMWGGGLYERDAFYEYCSQYGILIMHDFMYACNMYPDHDPMFQYEARREAEHQIKRLRNHACLAVFTGNNENQEAITDWYDEERAPVYFPGATVFNRIQPEMVRLHAPHIPYRPSSPFGGATANAQTMGDSHVWKAMAALKFREQFSVETFDQLTTKFMSEYGFHGALRRSSVERYMAGQPLDMTRDTWIHHGERQNKRDGILHSIQCHLRETATITVDDYLLYSGIMQGVLYRELAESLRRRETCHGNLIWMYNDCWPETGWTIIDYYLTRKIAFYYLKRAFAPIHHVLRIENHQCTVTLMNDTSSPVSGIMRYGIMTFDGQTLWEKTADVAVAYSSRSHVLRFDVEYNPSQAFVYAVFQDQWASSIRGNYRAYDLPQPAACIENIEVGDGYTDVTICSDQYIPIAYLDMDDRIHMDDNFFEMIPGMTKTIRIRQAISQEDVTLRFVKVEKD